MEKEASTRESFLTEEEWWAGRLKAARRLSEIEDKRAIQKKNWDEFMRKYFEVKK